MGDFGFYWVNCEGEWVIAEYCGEWYLPGIERGFSCEDFAAIGDKIKMPGKYTES